MKGAPTARTQWSDGMNLRERAAIGGEFLLPMVKDFKEQAQAKVGLEMTDDDLVFATVWAAMRHSVATTGGTAAIERLRDVLDEIEASGAFGIK